MTGNFSAAVRRKREMLVGWAPCWTNGRQRRSRKTRDCSTLTGCGRRFPVGATAKNAWPDASSTANAADGRCGRR